MKKTKFVERWLEKAEHDLKAAQLLYDAEHFTDTICFHIHQAIEKYLKGFLIAFGIRPQHTHDLKNLLKKCTKIEADFSRFTDEIDKISGYYIPTRYPVPDPITYSRKETREALNAAFFFKSFLLKKLETEG